MERSHFVRSVQLDVSAANRTYLVSSEMAGIGTVPCCLHHDSVGVVSPRKAVFIPWAISSAFNRLERESNRRFSLCVGY